MEILGNSAGTSLVIDKITKYDNMYFVMTKTIRFLRSGQITIPIDFREKLGIDPETLLQISLIQGELRIKPVHVAREAAQGSPWLKEAYNAFADVRKQMGQYRQQEINDAIDQAVKAVRKSHA